jgi:hypothetical protein
MDILARVLAQDDVIGSSPRLGCAWSPGKTAPSGRLQET